MLLHAQTAAAIAAIARILDVRCVAMEDSYRKQPESAPNAPAVPRIADDAVHRRRHGDVEHPTIRCVSGMIL
jgi:hypothetical protein